MKDLLLGMGKEVRGREVYEGRKEAPRSEAQRRARSSWAAGPPTTTAAASAHWGAPAPGRQRAQPEPARCREGGGEREKGQARRASAQLCSGKGAQPPPPGCGRPRCWRCSAAPRVSSARSGRGVGRESGAAGRPRAVPAAARPVPPRPGRSALWRRHPWPAPSPSPPSSAGPSGLVGRARPGREAASRNC